MAKRAFKAEFHFDIKEIEGEINKEVVELKKTVAFDLMQRLVLKSPVDTGRFRASWVVGINTPNREKPPFKGNEGGKSSINRIIDALDHIQKDSSIVISNNLDYALRLEYGWSKQAPAGIVDVSILELKAKYKGGRR